MAFNYWQKILVEDYVANYWNVDKYKWWRKITFCMTIFKSDIFITIPVTGSIEPFTVTSTENSVIQQHWLISCISYLLNLTELFTNIVMPVSIGIVAFWVNLKILFRTKLLTENNGLKESNQRIRDHLKLVQTCASDDKHWNTVFLSDKPQVFQTLYKCEGCNLLVKSKQVLSPNFLFPG